MLSIIQRSALFISGFVIATLAVPSAFAQTQSGFDTITGVHTLPIAVGGVAILTLSDNTPSYTVAVNGKLQLSGWLGIGTTTPAAPLDVEGTGGVILNAGYVGIGTTSPQSALDVHGTLSVGTESNGTGYPAFSANTAGDVVVTGGTDSRWGLYHAAPSTGGSPREAMAIEMNGVVDFMNGYVGIGTTAPQGNLDVENSTGTAKSCLNGVCTNHLAPAMTEVLGTITALNGQTTTAVSKYAHDICFLAAVQTNGDNASCSVYSNAGNIWTLMAQNGIGIIQAAGQTNCMALCYDWHN